jgi:hypothetical protein
VDGKRPGSCRRFISNTITVPAVPGHLRPKQREDRMNAQCRRKIEMGTRALEFSRAHPDADPGYAAAAAKLEQLMARASEATGAQRSGIVDFRAASARKGELKRTIQSVHLAHLAQVGEEAATENHELGKLFRFKPAAGTLLAFRAAAGTMADEAQANREMLVKYGLSTAVLEEFLQRLAQFDAAVALGNAGRAAHVGATAELDAVAAGIVRAVNVMDGRNRQRFQQEEHLLAEWISASTVLGQRRRVSDSPAPDSESPAGDVRPAA